MTFCLASRLSTTSDEYFHPTQELSLSSWRIFPRGFDRTTLRAAGTSIRFLMSYLGVIPSKHFKDERAFWPQVVLCDNIPPTLRQKTLDGARKWRAPRVGSTLPFFRNKERYFSLFRNKPPDMIRLSQRTTTIFCPVDGKRNNFEHGWINTVKG